VPMRILALDASRGLALCATEKDQRETVEIALVGPVAIGDELLVHAGTAIARLEDRPTGDRNTPGREAEELLR
jgi:hydrogenase expression/formation protein HypC